MSNATELFVYGGSDDLIEVKGLLSDEFSPEYGKPALVTVMVDDAAYAHLHVEYDPDESGEWRIQPQASGDLVSVVAARGEDEGDDEHRCPGYSDKAVVDMAGIDARRVTIRVTTADPA